MKYFLPLLLGCFMLIPFFGTGQVRVYNTKRVTGKTPVIDGKINDPAWDQVEWQGDFIQKQPYENAPPSQETAFKILYDDNNLYVAIRAFDTEPGNIVRRLGRRDNIDGDWVAIGISSHFDHLTGYGFAVNAAGVKSDGAISNDTDWDDSWDPVYYVKTGIDDKGWTAEFKIPFNQLRFGKKENYIWGLEIIRQIFRKEEMSVWQMVPQDASGWVSLWGELHGIENIKPKKEIALTPYLMGGIEKTPKEESNPFMTGTDWLYNGGLDGKIAVTNDLTLNFTINPDFGQVEADPSEVNLSAFESYFSEKRPFFVEGANIYKFPLEAGQSWSRDNLFYSRRIGRAPQGRAVVSDGYVKSPEFTRILGAFKLSGKTQNGWSIGVQESITNREYATIDSSGFRSKQIIEPFTNYFNTRIQKDLVKGKTIVGGMVTATNRFINDTILEFLPRAAYTGGLDFTQFWHDKAYTFSAIITSSTLVGSEEAILLKQTAPQRYYQRPDASRKVDSTLTRLTGTSGSFYLAKIGQGHWRYGLKGNFTSPGLSLNDMGYIRRSDAINQTGWVEYVIWEPFSIFRSMSMRVNQWMGWDFNGRWIYSGQMARFYTQFKNYWSVNLGLSHQGFDIDRHQLRGGPSLYSPGFIRPNFSISTDQRKKFTGDFFVSMGWGNENWRKSFDIGFELAYQPFSNLQLSIDPVYVFDDESVIYISTEEYNNNPVYLVSGIDRKSIQLNFRINFSITPDFTIQYWGQPFFFSGNYRDFKKVIDAGNKSYYDQFHVFTEEEISFDEEENLYYIDETGNGQPDYSFANPDFSFFEFRSNFVVRWEYIPGSTAYFVWSQGRSGYLHDGGFYLSDRINNLIDSAPTNIFRLKISYRLSF